MWIEYLALPQWFLQDRYRAERWRNKAWERLAWCARYGHLSLAESAGLELTDLTLFMKALNEILRDENKPSKRGK